MKPAVLAISTESEAFKALSQCFWERALEPFHTSNHHLRSLPLNKSVTIMDASARQNILSKLQQLSDAALSEIYNTYFKRSGSTDWWDDLSESEQARLQRGLEQADRGETVSSEEVHRSIDKLLGEE